MYDDNNNTTTISPAITTTNSSASASETTTTSFAAFSPLSSFYCFHLIDFVSAYIAYIGIMDHMWKWTYVANGIWPTDPLWTILQLV